MLCVALNLLFGLVTPASSYLLFTFALATISLIVGFAVNSMLHQQQTATENLQAQLRAFKQRESEPSDGKMEPDLAIHHMAMHDGLTGLPNRRQFMESLDTGLEQCNANGKQLAVMYIDLDHFKFVNDTYGHALGDALLQEVAAVIDRARHPSDVGARLGGDEFAVLMIEQNRSTTDGSPEGETADFNPQRLADSILEGVSGCKAKLGISGKFGASVGYSLLHNGTDEFVPEKAELLSRADLALYHVKETGKNAAVGYSAEIGFAHKQMQQWVAALPKALENNELTLQFQPQAVCESRELVGFEALVRWQSPVYGAVPPESILHAAELAGKVSDLTAWIVKNACSNLAQWPGELRLAINLSANELTNYWLCGHIAEELEKNNLEPSRLEIEITETVLIEDEERTRVALEQLSELGVTIALDDFGTGYSSLSMLVQYPINRIKIDRSFISRVEANSDKALISSTLIELAHGLGIRVLAEGVELDADANRLVRQNCDEFQGYLVGKPLPADEVAAFVENHVESNQKIRLIASQSDIRKAG